jgi:hypothetical protein
LGVYTREFDGKSRALLKNVNLNPGKIVMIQKFKIVRDKKKDTLTIKEFAILEKMSKNMEFQGYQEQDFSLIGQQEYKDNKIEIEIPNGKDALIATIRTKNLYPIQYYASAIADSIIELYSNGDGQPVELVFDDIDMIKETTPAP